MFIRPYRGTFWVPPHKRTVGHTFVWEFDLPVPKNSAYLEPSRTTSKSKKTGIESKA